MSQKLDFTIHPENSKYSFFNVMHKKTIFEIKEINQFGILGFKGTFGIRPRGGGGGGGELNS